MTIKTYKGTSVIVTSQFVEGDKKYFNDYINYLDRNEAKQQNDFASYNNYMEDNKKATSLFTKDNDDIDNEKKEKLKETFKKAQKRGSILWQDVVSFDNNWLADNGIYDNKTKQVDEKKLKNITRIAMDNMLEKNHINNNAVWSGAIHHNTDNIHIHLATVELSPTQTRGKRKLKTLEQMKSTYINKIMDRSHQHEKINDILRNKIVNNKKENKTFSTFNRTFKKDFLDIYKSLPENKRYWNYGYQNINHVKPKINELTEKYINKYFKEEYSELNNMLDKEVDILKQTYGEGKNNRYKDYKQNKINDLYKRMGNAFLKEMKEYDKSINGIESNKSNYSSKMVNAKKNIAVHQVKYGLDRLIYSELKQNKNQIAYQELQKSIEKEGKSL